MDNTPVPLGLYVHLPFCASRCGYCDFAVVTDRDNLQAKYVDCLTNEVSYWSSRIDRPLAGLYFGGGTPSRLDLDLWRRLMETIIEGFAFETDIGITTEANPDSLTPPMLEAWLSLGINRISLGVQSFKPRFLSILERRHTRTQAIDAVRNLRAAGFNNWSLDLIYGLPEQSLQDWQDDIKAALDLDPPHVSFYNLILHPNLPVTIKALSLQDSDSDDLQSEMFLCAVEIFEANGYEVYELSNAAKPGRECRHNLLYWTGGEWVGIGMSGSSFLGESHFRNPSGWKAYLEMWSQIPAAPVWIEDKASSETRLLDTIMLRLRTRWGIAFSEIEELCEGPLTPAFRRLVSDLGEAGHLRDSPGRLALSPKGWLVHSEITNRVVRSLQEASKESGSTSF
jgi:oxygen-independent coproporphyrinogen-3 oxidase